MRMHVVLGVTIASTVATVAPSNRAVDVWALTVESITSPAASDSGQPNLSASRRGVLLSWIERSGTQATLKFAERTPSGWTPTHTVARGSDWFINWADVPSVLRMPDGTIIAHWPQKSGTDTYAYDVRVARSSDGGKTWSPSIVPHNDATKSEHGFVSFFEMRGPQLGLVWLDGRAMAGGHEGSGGMALRFTSFDERFKPAADTVVDPKVCECCPTAAAVTADGPIVAYRDVDANQVRDIYVTRFEKGQWTDPRRVHADDWRINACPVNGPSLSARGRDVVIGWFTAKDDQPKSFAAFSSDSGRSFGNPIRLDDEGSLGRVDVELLPDGSAVAAYIEFANQRADFRVRRVTRDGTRSTPTGVSSIAGNRTSGYPRMARANDELVFAWIDRTKGSQVKTAVARLPR